MCCLSKGCAPRSGRCSPAPRDFIERARKYRKMLGGGMRQAGFLAAAGIIAIRDMPARLHIDHGKRRASGRSPVRDRRRHARSPAGNQYGVLHVDRPQKELEAIPAKMLKKGL